MPSADSRPGVERPNRRERGRHWSTVRVLAVFSVLVLIMPVIVGAGAAAALAASVRASHSGKDTYFAGALTVNEHLVWNYSSSFADEHGRRNITGHVTVVLVVSRSRVVSFKATGVTLEGTMHLDEQVHPSHCQITTTSKLDSTRSFSASGTLGHLAVSWPMLYRQVDVGPCPGEPAGTTVVHALWGSTGAPAGLGTGFCTTSDSGANGTVVYDSSYKPPFGTEGLGTATTGSCKGVLKRTAHPAS